MTRGWHVGHPSLWILAYSLRKKNKRCVSGSCTKSLSSWKISSIRRRRMKLEKKEGRRMMLEVALIHTLWCKRKMKRDRTAWKGKTEYFEKSICQHFWKNPPALRIGIILWRAYFLTISLNMRNYTKLDLIIFSRGYNWSWTMEVKIKIEWETRFGKTRMRNSRKLSLVIFPKFEKIFNYLTSYW